MMINELPKDFSSIATTFFEDYDNASRFAKDMEQNMKMLSGLDPLTTNKEVADYINDNNDKELLNGTEDALLQLDDRNAIELATQNMEALGVKKRVNPEISVYDYYTQNEIANKLADDTYRINFTNSKEDPSVYSTKYMIGSGKIYDALNSLKPNTTRLAMRYIGQPAVSLAMTAYGGAIGAGLSDAVMAGWDAATLGGTIYNTQKKYIDRYHQILENNSLSLEQFTSELDNLLTEIQTDVAPEYQYEIFNGIIEGPNLFSDAGLGFTTLGIQTYAKSFEFLAKTAKRMLPSGSVGNSIKRMQMNEKLVEQIQKSMSNKVDEAVVNEAISAKVETIKPKEASETDIEMVKGIDKNKAVDRDLLQNSNNDSAIFDITVSQEDIAAHSANTSAENRSQAAEEAFNKRQTIYAMRETAGQKGEIKLERPQQVTVTRVGKGVNNDPMTWEEVQKWKKAEQGRANPITPWRGNTINYKIFFKYNPDIEPDLIGLQSASRTRWTNDINKPGKWLYSKTENPGAGDEWFLGGGYGSSIDSPWIAAPEYYYKDFSPDKFDFRDYVLRASMDDKNLLKKAVKKFDPKGKTYKRTLSIYEDNRQEAIKSYKIDLAQASALDLWFKRHNVNPKDSKIIDKIESNMFDRYHRRIDMTNRYVAIDTSNISFKLVEKFFSKNKRDISSAINEAKDLLKKRDNEIKENVVKFIDDYEVYREHMLSKYPYLSEDDIFEFRKSTVYDQNLRRWEKPDTIDNPMNYEEVMFNKLIQKFKDIISSSIDSEGLYRLIDMAENYKKYSPPTAYLQTVGINNPMKNPKGIFYYDSRRGIVPFASLFNRANTPENMNKIEKIANEDYKILNSIDEDIEKGFVKTIKELPDGEKEILWTYGDSPEPWGMLDNTMSEKEIINKFREYRSMSPTYIRGMSDFRRDLAMYVAPKGLSSRKEYNSWEKSYLESKGFKNLWHNGGDSQSFNVSLQDLETVTPVTLEESGIGTPWWTQIGYHNAHMIESAGDGVGYYGLIVHAPEGAKPVIMKNGKIVDKGDWK